MSKQRKGKQAPAARTATLPPPAVAAGVPPPAPALKAAAADSSPAAPAPAAPAEGASPALTPVGFDYRKLALASPQDEFETYARQKVKTAERLGQKEDVEILLEAFEIGKSLLARKPEGRS